MTALPVDQKARDRALDPRESFHLEAPAGSGKTTLIETRFLKLLTEVEAPEDLLALTFTRKAAGELRARVIQRIWSKEEPGSDASPGERLAHELARQVFWHFDRKGLSPQLALAPERLPILTFHGFCARLVALAPQEAGIPLESRLLEDREAQWLKQEALEELRRRLAARPAHDPVRQALVGRLVRLNNNWLRLAEELRFLLARRDTLQDFLTLTRESRDHAAYEALMTSRLATILAPDLSTLKRRLAASELGRRWQEFWQDLQNKQAPLAQTLPPEPPRARLEDLHLWQRLAQALLTKQGRLRKKFPANEGFFPHFQTSPWVEVIKELPSDFLALLAKYRDVPLALFSPEEVGALHDLILLLWEALSVYEDLCRKRGVLDFIDLEWAALKLLDAESLSDLLLLLDWRLKHLLVDEFQDTSENQKTLLCRLLGGWEAGPGRTLTVVGDPKQSIYGWRQAKLSLFIESRNGLICDSTFNFPLEPLCLTTNFRATRTLITWVNEVFGTTVMASGQDLERLVFQPASPAPAAAAGNSPHLALFVDPDKLAAREAEARWLARQVGQALVERQEDETIGILLFARTHLKIYLQALQEAGLAVRVQEGLRLADSRVVQHLHNLTRALIRPHDEVSWVALLAGPWGPHPLGTIARAARSRGDIWLEKLRTFAGDETCPPDLETIILALEEAHGEVGRQPLEEVVRDFLNKTGAWAGLASWEGAAGVANARAYLDLLAEAESGLPETTFQKADFNLEDAYQPPDPRAEDSPVELMTVHGSKGLEFDWVFLPFLDWQSLRRRGRTPPPFILEEIPGSSGYGLALAPPYWQKTPSLLYRSLKNLEDNRVLAEARRVFYVAVTRARKRLFLSAVTDPNDAGQPKIPSECPLDWLWRHYRPGELPYHIPVTWPDPQLHVRLYEDFPKVERQALESPEAPPPWRFSPEPQPYVMEFPSQFVNKGLEGEDRRQKTPEGFPELHVLMDYRELERDYGENQGNRVHFPSPFAQEDLLPRLRGEVIHRLLETFSGGGKLPEAERVAGALKESGLTTEIAAQYAPEILAEVKACLADPFLSRLLTSDLPVAISEWLVEDAPGEGIIRRGKIDRFVYDGKDWWLLDYKTSRPQNGEDWEAFIASEAEKYRPQLTAYRDMAAKLHDITPEKINLALYFTACQRAVVR